MLFILAMSWMVGCDGPAPDPLPRGGASSSIVLSANGGALFVTSPDDDAVVEIDPETLEERRRFAVEGGPEHLALATDTLVVTLAHAPEIALIELTTGEVVGLPVPCGGTRAVVAHEPGPEDGDTRLVYVTCPHDDRLLLIDVLGWVAGVVDAPGRPTALAMIGDTLAVTSSQGGRIRELALPADWLTFATNVSERATHTPALAPGHAAIQMDALAPGPRGFIAAYQRVDHDSDRDRAPERGGYGSVIDGDPRIEPQLLGDCGTHYARFDGGVRVFSGPSALASAGDVVWIANRYTDSIAALDCSRTRADDAEAPLLAAWRVGRGPRGIALSADGRTAWIDEGFDHAVSRLTLARDGALHDPEESRRRTLGTTHLSESALRGRSLFNDAVDTHLTPSGVVTCATCHPGGGEDGLVWFLHTANVGPKLRRTPPAWSARRALQPFHWDGELPDGATLARGTIQELMEGDALLVDVDAIADYLDQAPAPPPRPTDPADAEATARAARGASLFAERCASCHSGPLFSDTSTHAVLAAAADPLAELASADTPSLIAVRTHPPYLHDGRAATLRDVLVTHNPDDRHGRTSDLSEADLAALLTYLETL